MAEDGELLRRYIDEGNEDAFTELVRRHLDLVYAAALRRVGHPQRAEDIAQTVFISLAQQASKLRHRPVLVGWLFTAVHFSASAMKRNEWRRQAREREVAILDDAGGGAEPETDWTRLRPVIDALLLELSESDREAVLMRYFQGRSFAAIAQPLRVSEDGARKRVERAVDKLRDLLARRGITSTPAALAAALSAQPSVAAPAGLAATIAGGAMTWAGLATGITHSIAMTTIHKTIAAAVLVAALGAGLYEARVIRRQKAEFAELQTTTKAAQAGERRALRQRDEVLQQASSAPPPGPNPGEAGRILEPVAEADPIDANVVRLRQRFAQMPERTIPELKLLTKDDWLRIGRETMGAPLDTDTDARAVFATVRSNAKAKLFPYFASALEFYAAANGGLLPSDPNQLAPFFHSPMDPAILGRYAMLQAGPLAAGKPLLGERPEALVDDEYETSLQFSFNGYRVNAASRTLDLVTAALSQYVAANGGRKPADLDELVPYLAAPADRGRLQKFFNDSQSPANLPPSQGRPVSPP